MVWSRASLRRLEKEVCSQHRVKWLEFLHHQDCLQVHRNLDRYHPVGPRFCSCWLFSVMCKFPTKEDVGFLSCVFESDRAWLNSLSKASHLLESLGINRIPSEEGPEVRRIECMMICFCRVDVFAGYLCGALLVWRGSSMIMYKVLDVISCTPVAEW